MIYRLQLFFSDTALHPLYWLYLPAASFLTVTGTLFARPDLYWRYLHLERGFVENAQAILLLASAACCARLWQREQALPRYFWLAPLLVFLFCFGEEINWGQVYLGFSSPPFFRQQNIQGDFNLHSIRGVPDMALGLLHVAAEIACIALVLVCTFSGKARAALGRGVWGRALIPPRALFPAAALLIISQHIYIYVAQAFETEHHYYRWACDEIMELQFYQLITLYLAMKLRSSRGARTHEPGG